VSDNGVVTPFLALRIAAEYIRADGLDRAVVVMLDQTVLLRDPARPAMVASPAENRVVVLVFERQGAIGEVSVDITPDTTPEAAGRTLHQGLDGRATATVVNDPVLGARTTRATVAPSGLPCTGPWVALAQGLMDWRREGAQRVVLGGYDPLLRLLGRCVIDL
jgi:hypothetical protein